MAQNHDDSWTDNLNFKLDSCFEFHNHPLVYETKEISTPEIIKEVDQLKGRTKSIVDFMDVINKKFDMKFNYNQISCKMK